MALSPSRIREPRTDVDGVEALIDDALISQRARLSRTVPMQCTIRFAAPLRAVYAALSRFERIGWEARVVGAESPDFRSGDGDRDHSVPIELVLTEVLTQSIGDETI